MFMQHPRFEETDVQVLHALIGAHPLGTWVTLADGELTVDHVPFLVAPERGALGTLQGHVSRRNPVWQSLRASAPSVVVFQGPECYISPSWYPSKHAHGKAVPTWNYAVVHARGVPVAIDDPAWLRSFLEKLTNVHEAGQALPWKLGDAPEEYVEQHLAGIVGIEIPITALAGKWKASQNRTEADRLGVMAGLKAQERPEAAAMAEIVARSLSTGDRR